MNFYEFSKILENYDQLKSISAIEILKPAILKAAQKVYDDWEQDENGHDHQYGGGGVCHDIASEIAGVLDKNGIEATTVSASIGTQHVYTIVKFQEGVYEIDISPNTYEIGAAYTWKKIPNVKFGPEDLIVAKIDGDPDSFENYSDSW
jgi:hypothetical protein